MASYYSYSSEPLERNIRILLTFVATGFIYLIIGTTLFLLYSWGKFFFNITYVFLIWFFGFVVMMVFGISYGFIPGFARSKFVNPTLAYIEYIALNVGVIATLIQVFLYDYFLYLAVTAYLISVLIHSSNMLNMIYGKKAKRK